MGCMKFHWGKEVGGKKQTKNKKEEEEMSAKIFTSFCLEEKGLAAGMRF